MKDDEDSLYIPMEKEQDETSASVTVSQNHQKVEFFREAALI